MRGGWFTPYKEKNKSLPLYQIRIIGEKLTKIGSDT
jgi:hypothetical protein